MMDGLDVRLGFYVVWGLGTPLIYAYVLRKRFRSHRIHHDTRSFRDLIEACGFLLVAIAASISLAVGIFFVQDVGRDASRLLSAIAVGAFTAMGIVMATERHQEDPDG